MAQETSKQTATPDRYTPDHLGDFSVAKCKYGVNANISARVVSLLDPDDAVEVNLRDGAVVLQAGSDGDISTHYLDERDRINLSNKALQALGVTAGGMIRLHEADDAVRIEVLDDGFDEVDHPDHCDA